MPEQDFTNREINEMFKDVQQTLDRIETQTLKTNGAVANINRWRERANGAFIASGIFMTAVILPIFAWAIYTLVNLPTTVHSAVDDALSTYTINTDDTKNN